MILGLTKEFCFEASHQLPNHDGKCARIHGHSWKLLVSIEGHVSTLSGHPKEGMVADYADIKRQVQPIIEMLDHYHLGHGLVEAENNIGGYGAVVLPAASHLRYLDFPKIPTSENILIWIAQHLPMVFPWVMLQIEETCTSAAILHRSSYEAG